MIFGIGTHLGQCALILLYHAIELIQGCGIALILGVQLVCLLIIGVNFLTVN